jgi:hypothetical protein
MRSVIGLSAETGAIGSEEENPRTALLNSPAQSVSPARRCTRAGRPSKGQILAARSGAASIPERLNSAGQQRKVCRRVAWK